MVRKTVIPSSRPITKGQVDKFIEVVGAKLRKSDLPSNLVQRVLEKQKGALAEGFVKKLGWLVEKEGRASTIIVRTAMVDPNRDLAATVKALEAVGFYASYSMRSDMPNETWMTQSMPKATSDEVEVHFFNLGCPQDGEYLISVGSNSQVEGIDIDKEYEVRGLKPVDPYTLAALNEADPAFARKYPNGTHWDVSNHGGACHMAFSQKQDTERRPPQVCADVYWLISRHTYYCWLAGVPK